MRCCGAKSADTGPKALGNRGCTDVLCLLLFAVFWAGLIAVFVLVTSTGDVDSLFYDADYLGNRCGVGNFSTRSKAYYPRMAEDLLEQRAYLLAGAVWKIKLYTLCVEACPAEFSIESPTIIHDYGYILGSEPTKALGSRTQAHWISILPTYDVLNRCVPYTDSANTETDLCAYPKCDAAEVVALGGVCDTALGKGEWAMSTRAQKAACLVKVTKVEGEVYQMQASDDIAGASDALLEYIAQAAGFLNDLVSSLQATSIYLVGFGILAPVVLSFAYALFLRFFAAVAVYTMLVVLVVAMVSVTGLCYMKAGMELGGVTADSLMADIQNQTGLGSDALTINDPTLASMIAVETGDTWLYEAGFWIMAVLTVVTVVLVFLWRKQLRMAIAIVQEACAVFRTMPSLMLFPFSTVLLVVGLCVFFLLGAFLLVTSKPEAFADKIAQLNATLTTLGDGELMTEYASGADAAAKEALSDDAMSELSAADGDMLMNAMAAYWFFGFLWTMQFVQACGWTTMSGAVVYWYFYRKDEQQKTRIPIIRSAGRVAKYHLGSMAFGALIIAACQFVRAIMEYLDRQSREAQDANLVLKLAMKSVKCCLWCFEKTVRFITGYGFVYVALEGSSFCAACFKTFKFILSNPAQAAVNTVVSKLLTVLAMVAIPVVCAAGAYAYFDDVLAVRNPMYPTFFVLLVSAIVSQCCASVFECTITTIFVSCFRDNELYGGKFMPEVLRKSFGMPKPGRAETDSLKGGKQGKGTDPGPDAELES